MRAQRHKRNQEPPQQFRTRIASLRPALNNDPAMAGDQAIKLLEEYLESLALHHGYQGEGSMGRYVMFLRGREALSDTLLDRAEGYTQLRNCLAHTFGLQVSPALAEELVDFIELLLKQDATVAADLMTRNVRVIQADAALTEARDLMVRGGYGRLPVIDKGEVVGLLTERDIVVAGNSASHAGLANGTVADALEKDALDRLAFVLSDAVRDQIIDTLRDPKVAACLVTSTGSPQGRVLGIITHADLLYRM
jgi:CBS domain-containing protein